MRRSRTPLPGHTAPAGLAWTSAMPRASAIRRSSGSKGHRGSPRGGRWRGPRRVEHPREPERRLRRHARAVRPSPTRCPPTSARRRSPWVHRAPAEPSASKLRRSSRPCRVVAVVGKASLGISLFRARLLFRDEFRMSAPPTERAGVLWGKRRSGEGTRCVRTSILARTIRFRACGDALGEVRGAPASLRRSRCWCEKPKVESCWSVKTHGRVRFHFLRMSI